MPARKPVPEPGGIRPSAPVGTPDGPKRRPGRSCRACRTFDDQIQTASNPVASGELCQRGSGYATARAAIDILDRGADTQLRLPQQRKVFSDNVDW